MAPRVYIFAARVYSARVVVGVEEVAVCRVEAVVEAWKLRVHIPVQLLRGLGRCLLDHNALANCA